MKVYFLALVFPILFSAQLFCSDYTVKIVDDLKQNLSNKSDVLGTNLALWTAEDFLNNEEIKEYLRALRISDIRIPGGSWSNEYYWNGNGVRTLNGFDLSKKNGEGIWNIDYNDYKPGFRVEGEDRHLADFHGKIDVLSQHEWIETFDANSFVCFNVGSGSPKMAEEWLKWAKKNKFSISRAEIGNELNGEWELGHKLKNGRNMNGDLYAEIFNKYYKSLKACDKDLLIGGPASSDLHLDFVETLIKKCGADLDFVSFHAYPVPVSTKSNKEKFGSINAVREPINKIRDWFDQYHRTRSKDIQIGISEWNMKVAEDVDTAGLINALWSACWLGTLYEEGVDFANQWDLSTEKDSGGHSMFNVNKGGAYNPKSIYWAMWVWSNLMGNELIQSSITPKKRNSELFCYSTRGKDAHQIMLVNSNEKDSIEVSLKLPKSLRAYKYQSLYSFNASEYFWDPYSKEVHWSNPPRKLNLKSSKKIVLDPFSLVVIHLGDDPVSIPHASTDVLNENIDFEIILPNKLPKKRLIDGWVTVSTDIEGRKHAYLGEVEGVLEIEYTDRIKRKILKFNNGISPFEFSANDDDIVSVRCYNTYSKDEHMVELFDQTLLPVVEWTFDDPIDSWSAESTFELGKFTRLKPNQSVAASKINNKLSGKNEDILFHFEPLDERVSYKGKINGVFGEISASSDFICSDKNASIQIVFQSDSDHWMPMGSILLNDIRGGWKNFKFISSSLQIDEKLSDVYGLRMRLNARSKFLGEIYLNDLGFIYKLDED